MIQAILFDVDGVLVNEEKKYFSYYLEKEYGISSSRTKDFFEGEFLECVAGKKDLRQVLPSYLQSWGWQGTLDEALHTWHTKEHIINEPLLTEIKRYKKKNIKVYTATNQEVYRTAYIRNEMGFGIVFDEVISSSMLGHVKPAEAYYKSILERIQCKPEDVLFWDDREENILAAKQGGLHAELYSSFKNFKQVMSDKYHL